MANPYGLSDSGMVEWSANRKARATFSPLPANADAMTDGHRTMLETGGYTSPGVTGGDVVGRVSSFEENVQPTTEHAKAALGPLWQAQNKVSAAMPPFLKVNVPVGTGAGWELWVVLLLVGLAAVVVLMVV